MLDVRMTRHSRQVQVTLRSPLRLIPPSAQIPHPAAAAPANMPLLAPWDVHRVGEFLDGLDEDGEAEGDEEDGVDEGAEDFGASPAVRVLL